MTFVDDQTNPRRVAILLALGATRTALGSLSAAFEDELERQGYSIVPSTPPATVAERTARDQAARAEANDAEWRDGYTFGLLMARLAMAPFGYDVYGEINKLLAERGDVKPCRAPYPARIVDAQPAAQATEGKHE